MYLLVWFGQKSYINTDRPINLPVNLGIANLMGSDLLVLYFRFDPLNPSDFKVFSDGFAMSAVAAVSMDPVRFYIISS